MISVGEANELAYTLSKEKESGLQTLLQEKEHTYTMNGKFISTTEVERDYLEWGTIGWLSRPETTGAKDIVAMEVSLSPGHGHDFHKHPAQEEVIYVIEGSIEQWLEDKKQTLIAGDSVFIAANIVHASFNVSSQPAKLFVTLSPCKGAEGYQLIDVYDEAPWNTLRS